MDIKALFKFLKELDANNNKEWFDANRKRYESLRKEMIAFTGDLLQGIQLFDPGLAGIEPKNCIFRINRDIRFSKDKAPYKTNFGALMNKGGKKEMMAGYYLHLDSKEIFIAGGAYMPQPDILAGIRQEIDYNFEEFKSIIRSKKAVERFGGLQGDSLSRPPRGYEEGNPAIEYIKKKSFIWVQNFTTKEAESPDFKKRILDSYKLMKPLNEFLNRCNEN